MAPWTSCGLRGNGAYQQGSSELGNGSAACNMPQLQCALKARGPSFVSFRKEPEVAGLGGDSVYGKPGREKCGLGLPVCTPDRWHIVPSRQTLLPVYPANFWSDNTAARSNCRAIAALACFQGGLGASVSPKTTITSLAKRRLEYVLHRRISGIHCHLLVYLYRDRTDMR